MSNTIIFGGETYVKIPESCEMLEYTKFCVNYREDNFLKEYISYFKTIADQPTEKLEEFAKYVNDGDHSLSSLILFRTYFNILRETFGLRYQTDSGIRLFMRAISVYNNFELAEKIIIYFSEGLSDVCGTFDKIRDQLDVEQTVVDKFAKYLLKHKQNSAEIPLQLYSYSPESVKKWILKNQHTHYRKIVKLMTNSVDHAKVLLDLIGLTEDPNKDNYFIRCIFALNDKELIATAIERYTAI